MTDFDRTILLWFRNSGDPNVMIGPKWLVEANAEITALGGGWALILIALIVAGALMAARRYRVGSLFAVSTLLAWVAKSQLKDAIGRARPTIVPHLVEVSSASFPSGHAMMSAVVYGMMGALLAHLCTTRALRHFVIVAAIGLVVLVGLTRVALGVHYPSDVLGGWVLGGLWSYATLLIGERLGLFALVERQRAE